MEILVQVRNKPYYDGKSIELPGGPVDDIELFLGVLRREVREETGLVLSKSLVYYFKVAANL